MVGWAAAVALLITRCGDGGTSPANEIHQGEFRVELIKIKCRKYLFQISFKKYQVYCKHFSLVQLDRNWLGFEVWVPGREW